MGSISLSFFVIYYLQKKQMPTLPECTNLALASGGLVTSIGLLYSLILSEAVKQVLDKEVGFDITGFYLGAIAVGWVSLQPITQLLQPNSLLGTVEDCQVHTGKIIYLQVLCKNKRMYRVVITEDLLNKISVNNRNNPSLSTLTNPDDLIGKKISILDVPSIPTGGIQELRISLLEQLVIR
uniref:Uncharacterized protein n=1 Tax=Nostoc flagelliforme str. Sunitezuoqi TaxID=676037 RepID=E7DPS4_9NOSO|nr:hypothetical protein Nfla_4103 [Nostoc flagelliforme str. Sunitezuoqi]